MDSLGCLQPPYSPHDKQEEFHNAGKAYRERLFMAGNQLGKTWAGAYEMAMHLTGLYPDWWDGRRFDDRVTAWAGSETGEVTRDSAQRLLLGNGANREEWGTNALPFKNIERVTMRSGVSGAVDTLVVKHIKGGSSLLTFKSYDQGREKWQGQTLNVVWFDEEPPADIYMEGLTRTNATNGCVYLTFTPLKGMSEVVRGFLSNE